MTPVDKPRGPLMLGIAGESLAPEEAEMLCHPAVGGVILFTRNYTSRSRLRMLCDAIHALRRPSLLIAVDHEGGRVQRFRQGFCALPAAARYGMLYDRDRQEGQRVARAGGRVMAAELRASGVDFSFAPVLDIDHRKNKMIGDRAFHRSPDAVSDLAHAYLRGMNDAGMAGVGKHFPGHGKVGVDSHRGLPTDWRPFEEIQKADLVPFERLIASGDLAGVMAAHIIYCELDKYPASFSRRWIGGVLRKDLGFEGPVFSDDLDMAAAAEIGDHVERVEAALAAGCDMALICNDPAGAARVLDTLAIEPHPERSARIAQMQGRGQVDFAALEKDALYRAAVDDIESSISLED